MQKPGPGAIRAIDGVAVGGLLFCSATWGVNQVAMKFVNSGLSPWFQAGLRSVLCAVLVALWCQMRGIAMFKRDGTFWLGAIVGLTFASNFACLMPGLTLTDASRGVLFLYSAPVFVAVGAHFLLPGEQLSSIRLAGLACAMAGLAVAMAEQPVGPIKSSMLGDLLCLCAGFFWSLSTLVLRATRLRTISPERTLLYQLVFSAPVLLGLSFALGEPGIVDPNPAVLWAFAYTVVVVVFISYIVWFWLLSNYPAAQVSVFTFLAPIFGVLAGHLLLGEPLTIRLGIALALVAAGIYLVNRQPAPTAVHERA
jgi:drug/metabolite transporter (DMT)-like permease